MSGNMRGSGFRFGRPELAALIAAAILAAGFFVWNSMPRHSGTALVSLDGRNIMDIPLATAPDHIITLRDEYGVPVDLQVKDGKIRFVNVVCPDHICENTGFIHKDGQSAVCMPNKVAVVVVSFQ